jgi:outer membrane protein assembly factor BamB
MKTRYFTGPVAGLLLGLGALAAAAENWPQWRGPFFNGSTTERNLPESWSTNENVLWSVALPGPGHATPAVWDDAVFVTSPDENKNLVLICLDRGDGKVRWQKQVGVGDRARGRNNMASPSPVTDGKTVWAMFGTGDLAAFDFSGRQLWTRNLGKDYGRFSIGWLYGSSPLLYKNRLYIEVCQRGNSQGSDSKSDHASYILCLDPLTGTNIWRHIRPTDAEEESQEAYTTPMPSEQTGHTEIVVLGGGYVTGQDPDTGEELWRGGGLVNLQHRGDSRIVPSPVIADGLVFVNGPKHNPLLAYRDGGHGDITSSGLAWSYDDFPTDCVTPLLYQGKLFVLDGDKQMMVCLDPKTGQTQWKKSLGIREIFRASPTGADDKIYCFSEYATAVVLSAADGHVLSTIPMDDQKTELSHSTIVAAQGCLFVRTPGRLYCIGKRQKI